MKMKNGLVQFVFLHPHWNLFRGRTFYMHIMCMGKYSEFYCANKPFHYACTITHTHAHTHTHTCAHIEYACKHSAVIGKHTSTTM